MIQDINQPDREESFYRSMVFEQYVVVKLKLTILIDIRLVIFRG
jgi:hypothetical protein